MYNQTATAKGTESYLAVAYIAVVKASGLHFRPRSMLMLNREKLQPQSLLLCPIVTIQSPQGNPVEVGVVPVVPLSSVLPARSLSEANASITQQGVRFTHPTDAIDASHPCVT